jgi:hypothetical protein
LAPVLPIKQAGALQTALQVVVGVVVFLDVDIDAVVVLVVSPFFEL